MELLLFNEISFEIVGQVSCDVAPPNSAAVPEGFIYAKKLLWKYNDTSEEVEMKTGQELTDAQAIVNGETVASLIEQYAGPLVNPVTQGSMEEIVDLMVQAIQICLVDGGSLTAEQKTKLSLITTACSPYYKLEIDSIVQADADGMAAKKNAARQAETDMKNDPNWPS